MKATTTVGLLLSAGLFVISRLDVGSAVGIALMGPIYGSHYRSNLPAPPDQLPADAAEAARDSAGAGLHVADRSVPGARPWQTASRPPS
ncbi:hypothetical protein [Streptomyces paromomycinus]|uniref:MFS transporter n=1 Tax=Streptomyces paromomycinus TaxID=92743 RepID=A0A401WG09_STREY|nr:hypothetical protein [Streptomyces paromomycinus]GCD48218.1 MFS transporter [Streptomyces paromomycinus]